MLQSVGKGNNKDFPCKTDHIFFEFLHKYDTWQLTKFIDALFCKIGRRLIFNKNEYLAQHKTCGQEKKCVLLNISELILCGLLPFVR